MPIHLLLAHPPAWVLFFQKQICDFLLENPPGPATSRDCHSPVRGLQDPLSFLPSRVPAHLGALPSTHPPRICGPLHLSDPAPSACSALCPSFIPGSGIISPVKPSDASPTCTGWSHTGVTHTHVVPSCLSYMPCPSWAPGVRLAHPCIVRARSVVVLRPAAG